MTNLRIAAKSSAHWLTAGQRAALNASADRAKAWTELVLDAAALAAAYVVAFDATPDGVTLAEGALTFLWLPAAVLFGVVCLAVADAYANRRPLVESVFASIAAPVKGSLAGATLFVLVRVLSGSAVCAHSGFAFICGAVLSITAERVSLQLLLNAARYAGYGIRRILLVGPTGAVRDVAAQLKERLAPGLTVAGTLAVDLRGDAPLATVLARVAEAVNRFEATDILVLDPALEARDVSLLAGGLRGVARVRVASSKLLALAGTAGLPFDNVGNVAAVEFGAGAPSRLERGVKRAFDRAFSFAALIALLPLWALLIPLLLIAQGRPVFFRQTRTGGNGRRFVFFKFRTMVNGADRRIGDPDIRSRNVVRGPMFKCPSDPRVTRVGAWLRRFSIDETPQFINALRGDISVVGVRPPLPEEVDNYEEWHRARLSGWMGITGLWQVSGRSDLDFDEIVLLDLYYNSNFSLAQDTKIVWKTVGAVLGTRGAY